MHPSNRSRQHCDRCTLPPSHLSTRTGLPTFRILYARVLSATARCGHFSFSPRPRLDKDTVLACWLQERRLTVFPPAEVLASSLLDLNIAQYCTARRYSLTAVVKTVTLTCFQVSRSRSALCSCCVWPEGRRVALPPHRIVWVCAHHARLYSFDKCTLQNLKYMLPRLCALYRASVLMMTLHDSVGYPMPQQNRRMSHRAATAFATIITHHHRLHAHI